MKVASLALKSVALLCDIAYLVVIGIALYQSKAFALDDTYAVALAIVSLIRLVFHSQQSFEPDSFNIIFFLGVYVLFDSVFFSIFAWMYFQNETGYNPIHYGITFGLLEWRKLPLLYQIMYFNFWMDVVLVAGATVFIGGGILLHCCFPKLFESSKPLEVEDTPNPLVAVKAVSV
ncbi:hypothetical protein BDR26DRAFT_857701 [Obelidium mucronatum]|nr:hypothetical protein BDR26DRAFT_857701 [Obelidium mucronatum]